MQKGHSRKKVEIIETKNSKGVGDILRSEGFHSADDLPGCKAWKKFRSRSKNWEKLDLDVDFKNIKN